MDNVVIVSAARTPIGAFLGALADVPAPRLGATAIQGALAKAGLSGSDVDEVIMGCVLTAGVGQAPARQAAIFAELSNKTPCTTINKVCGSGLKAVMMASQAIRCGDARVVVAGGMENMSRAPFLLERARTGYRLGHGQLLDAMIRDGLWDVYNDFHMGNAAELCAREKDFSRAAQDEFAKTSYQRARAAQEAGRFSAEIVAVEVPQRKGDPLRVDQDEEPGKSDLAKMPKLRPAFEKDGTITAANASKINDGASALVVMAEEEASRRGLKPLARIVSQAQAAHAPEWFTTAPVAAMQASLDKAGLKASDIDLWEINEAFAVVTMAAVNELGLDPAKVNVNGGAVALGHPIGASGARIFTTLLHAMADRNAKRGVASLCIGGGEAVSVVVERDAD
jgi:acetyl-CoA C-acetyltransferase